jgi:hypothetical protein
MSRKNAAIGNASATSRAGMIYGAGEPSNQTTRREMIAKEGMIVIILMILFKIIGIHTSGRV